MSCMLCRRDDSETLQSIPCAPDAQRAATIFRIERCKNCGLVYTTPSLDEENLANLGYAVPDTMHPARETPQGMDFPGHAEIGAAYCRGLYRWVFEESLALRTLHGAALACLFPFYGKLRALAPYRERPGRLIEVGCGDGRRLRLNAEYGWEAFGVDSNAAMVDIARSRYRVEAVCGPSTRLGAEARSMDAAFIGESLTRLAEPRATLFELLRVVKDTGFLMLELPNHALSQTALWGADWSGYGLPFRHYHYTVETASRLLAECGWRVVRVAYRTSPRIWASSLESRLARTGRLPGLLAWIRARPAWANLLLTPLALTEKFLLASGEMTLFCRKEALRPFATPEGRLAAAAGAGI